MIFSPWFREERRYSMCLKSSLNFCYDRFFDNSIVKNGIVVSLTTTPKRLPLIEPMLNSLITQTILPEKIIINLPKLYREETPYTIPSFLENKTIIEIFRTEKDYGPATKFIPSICRFQNTPMKIIVLDDDKIYSELIIENYLKKSEEYPECALALGGWLVPEDFEHNKRKFQQASGIRRFKRFDKIKNDQRIDIVQGASSYMIKPSFFDQSIFDYMSAPKSAFFVDDIWMSGHLARKNVTCMLITLQSRYMRLNNKKCAQIGSLHANENHDHVYNNEIYRYFASDWNT
jgi:hypothetical protein